MQKKAIVLSLLLIAALLAFSSCSEILSAPLPSTAPASTTTPSPASNPKLVIDPNIGSTPTPAPTAPGIAIPGWVAIHLPSNATAAEVALYNPPENAGWYYLTFELQLQETGEVIFSTGLVPPGYYCTKVDLTRRLEAGEYAAVMFVQPYRMNEDQTPTNNAQANVTLIVD